MRNKLLAGLFGFLANHLVVLVFLGFLLFAIFNRGDLVGCSDQTEQAAVPSQPVVSEQPEFEVAQKNQVLLPEPSAIPSADMTFRPLPTAESAKAEIAAPIVESSPPVGLSIADKMHAARNAFWQGDYALAEQHYRDYLGQQPDDANVLGELANVYQAQGKIAQALDTYFAAGMRFKALGQQDKLNQLVSFFQAANDPRALMLQE